MKYFTSLFLINLYCLCFSQNKNIVIQTNKDNKVYLIKDKTSKLYTQLLDFTDFDSVFDKNDKSNGRNSKWLRVEKYNKNYVLYAPCDWINDRKMIIENFHLKIKHGEIQKYKLVKHGNLGENAFYAEHEIDSISKNKFSFKAKMINEKPLVYEFEFSKNNTKWKENYTKADNISDFDIVYNECKLNKVDEFEF